MATDSARQAVFQTAELLEHVLSFLPLGSIWKCQGVSKHFRCVLAQSLILQNNLLLRESRFSRQEWRIIHLKCHETQKIKTCFQQVTPKTPPAVAHHVPESLVPTRFCPLLRVRGLWKGVHRDNSAVRLHQRPGEQATYAFNPRVDMSQLGSWKDTYISDPPCFEANVSLRLVWRQKNPPFGTTVVRDETWIEFTRRISNPQGLKMGDLLRMPFDMAGPMRWYSSWKCRQREIKRPIGILAKLVKEMEEPPVLDGERSSVMLTGMVFPTEAEWQTIL